MPPKIRPTLKEIEDKNSKSPNSHYVFDKLKYQSLESLLHNPQKIKHSDPINQIWQDKLKISRFRISSLINALALREKIKHENIYRINYDICKIDTLKFAMANDSSLGRYTTNIYNTGLEKTVSGLEREKRTESIGCWKDILMMRKDLIEAVSEYLSLKRKMGLLGIKIKNNYNG
jgi:hypothetical protein